MRTAALLRRSFALAAVLLLTGCGTSRPLVAARQADTLEAPGATRLEIDNAVGDVLIDVTPEATTVRASVVREARAVDEAAAQALLPAIEATLEHDPATGTVRAVGRVPKASSRRQGSVSWRIEVPPTAAIDVTCAVGSVRIAGDGADVVVRVDVGAVEVRGARGSVDARSDVGEIDVEADALVRATTDVGSIRAAIARDPNGRVIASADVGGIVVALPAGWTGAIDAESDVGDVVSLLHADARTSTARRLRSTVGTGHGAVEASTSVGEVRLQRRD